MPHTPYYALNDERSPFGHELFELRGKVGTPAVFLAEADEHQVHRSAYRKGKGVERRPRVLGAQLFREVVAPVKPRRAERRSDKVQQYAEAYGVKVVPKFPFEFKPEEKVFRIAGLVLCDDTGEYGGGEGSEHRKACLLFAGHSREQAVTQSAGYDSIEKHPHGFELFLTCHNAPPLSCRV